jgi:hypothetical protein
MNPQTVLCDAMAGRIFLIVMLVVMPVMADDEPMLFPPPTSEQLKSIQEQTLRLLRDIRPASSAGRKLKTMGINGGLVYWGNLFDPEEVVALVDLAPEKPVGDDWPPTNSWGAWPCYLSLCVWEKNHWAYRQYLDNANSLSFHDRLDKPHHFVQASRKTGRYEGDYLSWYYDPATKTLVRTHYETWGPIFLSGDYLCTTNGFERRSMNESEQIYSYRQGRKGRLLASYDEDTERPDFSIAFRDQQTGNFWTYSFHGDDDELTFGVDAVAGAPSEKIENPDTRTHYAAEVKLTKGGQFPSFCFERLTGLSPALVPALNDSNPDGQVLMWSDLLPKTPAIKPVEFEISGDPEIVRHLKTP